MDDARPTYAFGDTDVAARRLALVASVFEPPSRAFLEHAVPSPPAVALDLGCGPGFTTRLVAAVTGADRVVGIDASAAFLERARATAPPGCDFVEHDVTTVPLPGAPADVVYCRLLLAHLPDPAAVVAAWAGSLRPGGRLLLDELESMTPEHPLLEEYERVVVDLVAATGGLMYAGPAISGLTGGEGWRRVESAVRVLPIAGAVAARMYAMNLAVWRHDPHIVRRHPAERIDRLGRELDRLAATPAGDSGVVTWRLRHMVFEADA